MPRQGCTPLPPLDDSAHQLRRPRQYSAPDLPMPPFTPSRANAYHDKTPLVTNTHAIPSDSLDGLVFDLPMTYLPRQEPSAYHVDTLPIANSYANTLHSLNASTHGGEDEGKAELAWITCELVDCKSAEYHRRHTLPGKTNPTPERISKQNLCFHPLEGTGWSQEFGINMATGIPSDAFRNPQLDYKGNNGRKRVWDNEGDNGSQVSSRRQRRDGAGAQGHPQQLQQPKTMIMTAFGQAAYSPGSRELQYLQQCEAERASIVPRDIGASTQTPAGAEEEEPTRRTVRKRRRVWSPI